jgi:effector-binding domain-containing protein
MYKIGEFSKIAELTVKALRYYDEIGLLKPVKVDAENGYRFYDEASYQKAKVIKILKSFDFGIQEMLEAVPQIKGSDDLSAYLLEKHAQLSSRIQSTQKMMKSIETSVESLKEAVIMNKNVVICVKEVPEQRIASLKYKGKYSNMGEYIGELMKAVGGSANGPIVALYYDESYMEDGAEIEVAVPVKKSVEKGQVKTRTLTGGKFLSVIHIGPYERLSESYKAAMDYLEANGMKTRTPSREVYLKGPGMLLKGNPEKYETEILMEIE